MNKRIRILTAALGISAACMLSMPVFAAWQQDANGYYYMNGNSRVYSNWLRMANSNGGYTYYYINQNGYMVTGWQKLNNVWYYFNADGTMATGWKQIDGAWYYLDPQSGQMKTGWYNQQNNGVTEYYYLKDSGAMATGWRQIDGAWYYFLDDGVCVINLWVQVNGKWYFCGTDGKMKTGWQQINNNWYYLDSSGAMQTGWLRNNTNNTMYYCDTQNGTMATGWHGCIWTSIRGPAMMRMRSRRATTRNARMRGRMPGIIWKMMGLRPI